MTYIAIHNTSDNGYDIFSGADLREAFVSLLHDQGGSEKDIPDGISVYKGKGAITEHDGDRFWIKLISTWVGEEKFWGLGSTEEEAIESVFS